MGKFGNVSKISEENFLNRLEWLEFNVDEVSRLIHKSCYLVIQIREMFRNV